MSVQCAYRSNIDRPWPKAYFAVLNLQYGAENDVLTTSVMLESVRVPEHTSWLTVYAAVETYLL